MTANEIDAIHWHDSQLMAARELTEQRIVVYDVAYPVDWDNNVFEPRVIVFKDVTHYEIRGMRFSGHPTIISAKVETTSEGRRRCTLETNAGSRVIECGGVELRKQYP